jgi:hypothetical protein
MITLLIGVNSFVFMAMREVPFTQNASYTAVFVLTSIFIIGLFSYSKKIRRRKSSQENNLSS